MELHEIAAHLEAKEDTIIMGLIERAQYGRNREAYDRPAKGFKTNKTLFWQRMALLEAVDVQFGRFEMPEEVPFTQVHSLPLRINPIRPALPVSKYHHINLTKQIANNYFTLLDQLCATDFDGHLGSSVEADVHVLRHLSERIHYGAFYVAQKKYDEQPETYRSLIDRDDQSSIEQLLTRPEKEEEIIRRVDEKARSFQQGVNLDVRKAVDPGLIVEFYRHSVIPLTKLGEVRYLIAR
ncbi:chorismate mutase [Candidatus Woesearchaeota archaeon]|nr:chorismate mutase [Candidatus Woesearchaeota archaeon]